MRRSGNQFQKSILDGLAINDGTYTKIIKNVLSPIGSFDSELDKLRVPGKIIQIDEISLKYKVNACRG